MSNTKNFIVTSSISIVLISLTVLLCLMFNPNEALAVGDRYWIGGPGNWTDTAHWSLSDGGAGGASYPTSSNDARFTSNSDSGAGFTVTIDTATQACLTWDSSGVDQVMTIAGSQNIMCYASLTWKSDHVNNWTGGMYFYGTGGGDTVDFAGIALNGLCYFNGVGGDWTLNNILSCTSLTVFNGSLDTNDYAITTTQQCTLNAAGSLDLGASVWTYGDDFLDNNIGTFTCGTSTIEFTATNMNFYGGAGNTYYDVEFTGNGYVYVEEQCTYHDLTRTITTDNESIMFFTDCTVTGTLYANGASDANRLEVKSNTGAVRTITAAATSTQYSSWYFIKGAGAAAWNLAADTGGACDKGYCQDITFTTDIYYVSGTSLTTSISRTSGGTVNNDWGGSLQNYSGRYTTLYFDANSLASASLNIQGDRYFGTIDASALASSVVLDASSSCTWYIYGDYTGSPLITGNPNEYWRFYFQGTISHDFDPNGQEFGFNFTLGDISASTGNVINLLDDFYSYRAYSNIQLYWGLDTNNFSMECPSSFHINSSSAGQIDLGTSTIDCLSFSADTSSITANSSIINCERFAGGGATYNEVNMYVDSYGYIDGTNTFYDLYVAAQDVTNAAVEIGADQLIINDLIMTGYNASTKRLAVKSDIGGTQRTLYVNHGYALQYCDVSDMVAAGSTSPWDCSSGLNVDMGNNLYISFTPASNCYWVGNSGPWSDPSHWSSTSGGSGGTGRVPIGNDSAIFDTNSVTLPLQTITMDMLNIPTISAAAIQNNPTFSGSVIDVYGTLNLGNLTFSVTTVTFKGKENHTLASLNTITSEIIIEKSQATMAGIALNSSIVLDNDLTLLSGTFRLSVFNLTCENFISTTTTYNRALDLGTGILTLLDVGACFDVEAPKLTVVSAPNSTIVIDNDTTTACTFDGGSKTYGNITIMGAAPYIQYFSDSNSFSTLTVDRSEAAKTISGSCTLTITNLSIPISGTTTCTITNTDFVMTTGEIYGDYLVISGSAASGGGTFWASAGGHSTDNGGNTGWLWTVPTPPTIVTLDASDVSYLGEQLNGSITSMGQYSILYCYFEYGPTTSYGFETSPQDTLTAIGDFDFYLSPYKIYHYRAAVYYGLGFIGYGADKVISLTGSVGQATADISDLDITSGTPLVDDTPDEPDNMYDEGNTGGIPIAPLINPALIEADVPIEVFWYVIAFTIAIAAGFFVYKYTRDLLMQSILSAGVMACFCGGGALGDGLLPYFTVLVFGFEAIMVYVIKERQTV